MVYLGLGFGGSGFYGFRVFRVCAFKVYGPLAVGH